MFFIIKMKIFILLLFSTSLFAQNKNTPKVLEIYPTTGSIPVNILRFYIQFSSPMQEIDILRHIKLTNEKGENITGVFFENQYELWNKDRTKITLIIDPGRVKSGLFANNEMGRAFDEGKKYTLEVDSLLLDFKDQKLSESFTKKFVAVKEDNIPPDPKLWKLSLPKTNTKNNISIAFNDKIDHISAQTLIRIFKDKKPINGKILLAIDEEKISFVPNNKWKKGKYQILINPQLEDISANSVNQIFDHKLLDFKPNNKDNITLNFIIE